MSYSQYFKQQGSHTENGNMYVVYQPYGFPLILKNGSGRVLATLQVFFSDAPIDKQNYPIPVPHEGGFQIIFQSGDLIEEGRPIEYVVTNHCKEAGYVKFDFGFNKLPSCETDPPENINNVNEIRSFESFAIKSNQLDSWKQLIIKAKKKTNSDGTTSTVSLKEETAAKESEKVGTYLYFTVTPQKVEPLCSLFKDVYWCTEDTIVIEKNPIPANFGFGYGYGHYGNQLEGANPQRLRTVANPRRQGFSGGNPPPRREGFSGGNPPPLRQLTGANPGIVGLGEVGGGNDGAHSDSDASDADSDDDLIALHAPPMVPHLIETEEHGSLDHLFPAPGAPTMVPHLVQTVEHGSIDDLFSAPSAPPTLPYTLGAPSAPPILPYALGAPAYSPYALPDPTPGSIAYAPYSIPTPVPTPVPTPGTPHTVASNPVFKSTAVFGSAPVVACAPHKMSKPMDDIPLIGGMSGEIKSSQEATESATLTISESKVAEMVGGKCIIQAPGNATHAVYDYSVRTVPKKIGLSIMDLAITKAYPVITADQVKAMVLSYIEIVTKFKESEFAEVAKTIKQFRSEVCTVCLDPENPPNTILVRCGHVCTCSDECTKILGDSCPMCRAKILCRVDERKFLANC
jgi:hypothetical protein